MGVKFANNAYGTLNASITSSDTSLTLSSGQGARFPSLGAGDYFYVTLIDTSNNLEIAKCTARSSDVLTITRGQEGTTSRAYSVGDRVELRITAGGLDEIQPAIDDLLPSQTGNSGKYLTTNGTASSWGTITAPTAAVVSDQNNTSTGYFDLPVGTRAQRPGSSTVGMLRYNSDNRSIETYNDFIDTTSNDGWTSVGGYVLIARTSFSNAQNSVTLNWGTDGPRYYAYKVVINSADPSSSTARMWMRIANTGSPLTSGYGYTQNWRASNDGALDADSNANFSNGAGIDHIKLTNYNPVDSGYWVQANGEWPILSEVEIISGTANNRTVNGAVFKGTFSHKCSTTTYGETGGEFNGVVSTPNSITGTNGQVWYPITGVQVGWHDAYTWPATTGNHTVISVYGLAGFEERDN